MKENQQQINADQQHMVETFGPLAESDPLGIHQHEPGAKLDAGKPRAGLVLLGFARALSEVAEVGTYGAAKYTANGWLHVPNGHERYTDAMLRHLLYEAAGEQRDKETGIRHAAHCCWNALARLDIMLRITEEHDALHKSSRQGSKN